MSYRMNMNMIPDVYREETYPKPAGFPDLNNCQMPLPVMEDYLHIHYVGEPAYNTRAGLIAYTASYWNTEAPYRKQDFIEQIKVIKAPVNELEEIAEKVRMASGFGKDPVSAAKKAAAMSEKAKTTASRPEEEKTATSRPEEAKTTASRPEKTKKASMIPTAIKKAIPLPASSEPAIPIPAAVTITAGGSKENQPSILSDGTILFLSNAASGNFPERGEYEVRLINEYCEAPQLFSWKDGKVTQLTHMLHGVKNYKVSPDEKKILLSCWLYYLHDTVESLISERSEEDRTRLLAKSRFLPISYDSLPFKSDEEYGYSSKRKETLWILNLDYKSQDRDDRHQNINYQDINYQDINYQDINHQNIDCQNIGCQNIDYQNTNRQVISYPDNRYHLDMSNEETLYCLSEGNFPCVSPVWTPDSLSLTYLEPNENNTIRLMRKPVNSSNSKPVFWASVKDAVFDYNMSEPIYRTDGSLLIAACRPGDHYGMPRMLCCIPAEGGENLPLFKTIDPEITIGGVHPESYNFASRGKAGKDILPLSDGSFLFTSCKDGNLALFSCAPDTTKENGFQKPVCITGEFCNFTSLVRITDRLTLALYSDAMHLPELALILLPETDSCTTSKEDSLILPLTDSNPWLSRKKLSQPVPFYTKTYDWKGQVQGWVIPPVPKADFFTADGSPENKKRNSADSSEETGMDCRIHGNDCMNPGNDKKPAILYVHGGPSGFYCTAMCLEFQALSAAGFYVIYGNPRGGGGYGYDHGNDENCYGSVPTDDLLAIVEEACRLFPEIASERIGITGGSYGGYATIWSASHTHRYKAASAIRPLGNMLMIAGSSRNAGAYPGPSDRESFLDVMLDSIHESPNSYADRIEIPFQILQSENDANCVPDQMHQLYTSIKDLHPDLPCRLVLYPDANHGLLNKGPMYLAVMQRIDNLRWFERYL